MKRLTNYKETPSKKKWILIGSLVGSALLGGGIGAGIGIGIPITHKQYKAIKVVDIVELTKRINNIQVSNTNIFYGNDLIKESKSFTPKFYELCKETKEKQWVVRQGERKDTIDIPYIDYYTK